MADLEIIKFEILPEGVLFKEVPKQDLARLSDDQNRTIISKGHLPIKEILELNPILDDLFHCIPKDDLPAG